MSGGDTVVKSTDVFDKEVELIRKRRENAGLPGNQDDETIRESLIGLALSGGGNRSGSFNLGLIQALYEKNLLKDIDYLSTVSGGGYIGGYLSSLAQKSEPGFHIRPSDQSHANNLPNGDAEPRNADQSSELPAAQRDGEDVPSLQPPTAVAEDAFPIASHASGKQRSKVRQFILGGKYLHRPLLFLNRYLIGLLLINFVCFSGLVAAGALVALVFRCLDYPPVQHVLAALGFRGDVLRALFPSALFLFAWAFAWTCIYVFRSRAKSGGTVTRTLLILSIASFCVAIAGLLGTGDIDLTALSAVWGSTASDTANSVGSALWKMLLVMLVAALVPYVSLRRLIRSGAKPKHTAERWTFNVASRALLFGIPLLVFALIAKENISGYNDENIRDPEPHLTYRYDLHYQDIPDWTRFWLQVQMNATAAQATKTTVDSDKPKLPPNPICLFERFPGAGEDSRSSLIENWCKKPKDEGRQTSKKANLDISQLLWDEVSEQVEEWRQLEKEIRDYDRNTLFLLRPVHVLGDLLGLDQKLDSYDGTRVSYAQARRLRLEKQKEIIRTINDRVLCNEQQFQNVVKKELADVAKPVVKENNWQLLSAHSKKHKWTKEGLRDKKTIYAAVVLVPDQEYRLVLFLWALGIFLAASLVVNLNATSVQGYYRNRLARMWIESCPEYGRNIPLKSLNSVDKGAPYHLISATLNALGVDSQASAPRQELFLFSQAFCGSETTEYNHTVDYDNGKLDLPDAIAVSGAAVSPVHAGNPLLAVLLTITNSRMGQWLPNPATLESSGRWKHGTPTPLSILLDLIRRKIQRRKYCFVTDGGHIENLGIEPLLHRRCSLIIAADVGQDSGFDFADFVKLKRRMRVLHGIKLSGVDGQHIQLDELLPLGIREKQKKTTDKASNKEEPRDEYIKRLSNWNHLVMKIEYPASQDEGRSPKSGYLIYIKPTLTDELAVDLTQYARSQPQFPHDPSFDQFYDPQKFESYRQLGFHVMRQVCEHYPKLTEWCQTRTGAPFVECPTSDQERRSGLERLPVEVTPETLPVLLKAVENGTADERVVAAFVLGEQQHKLGEDKGRVVDILLIALDETDARKDEADAKEAVRERMLLALEEIYLQRATARSELQKTITHHSDDRVRHGAIRAYCEFAGHTKKGREFLRNLANGPESSVATLVQEILRSEAFTTRS